MDEGLLCKTFQPLRFLRNDIIIQDQIKKVFRNISSRLYFGLYYYQLQHYLFGSLFPIFNLTLENEISREEERLLNLPPCIEILLRYTVLFTVDEILRFWNFAKCEIQHPKFRKIREICKAQKIPMILLLYDFISQLVRTICRYWDGIVKHGQEKKPF